MDFSGGAGVSCGDWILLRPSFHGCALRSSFRHPPRSSHSRRPAAIVFKYSALGETLRFASFFFVFATWEPGSWIQERNDRSIEMAWLRTLLVAAAVAVAAAEKGDLYGKDGKEKNSLVEQVPLSRGAESSGRAERGTA